MTAFPLSPLRSLKNSVKLPHDVVLRIRVRRNAPALDRQLAEGADPNATEELELRAAQLANQGKREQMARSIDDVLEIVDRASGRLPTVRAPIYRRRVHTSRAALARLAEKLRSDGPHAVQGLAMTNVLLEDSKGLLYTHELSGEPLEPYVEATLSALDPGDAHAG
jgi:hypothetical protein